jgi:hypothetical protein
MSCVDFYFHKAARCEMLARVSESPIEREEQLETARHYRAAALRERRNRLIEQLTGIRVESETSEAG